MTELRAALKRKPTIDDVMASLARLRQERDAAEAGLASTLARRRDLLLEDAPDEAFAELDREADHHHLVVERLEVLEPELLAQLHQLRDAARRARWIDLVAAHDTAARSYFATAARLIERHKQVLAVWDEAAAGGFGERAHRFLTLPSPHVVAAEVVYSLEREFARLCGVAQTAPKPAPAAVQPKAAHGRAHPAPAKANGHANGHAAAAPVARPRRQPRRPAGPAAAGEATVEMLRSGVELEDGTRLTIGDRVNLPAAVARQLVQNGAADFVAEAS